MTPEERKAIWERVNALQQKTENHSKEEIINNYNLKSSRDNSLDTSNSVNDKNNNNYKGLYLKIHTDKTFLLAQDWGMAPGLLYNLCKTYGTHHVRECILKVKGIGPKYFKEGQPIEPQRGRYCRAVILNEGKRLVG